MFHHNEAVSDPQRSPATRTFRHLSGLTVESDGVGRDVADSTTTDEVGDLASLNWHHRQRRRRRQPVGLVVATGVVADVHEVAEHERHRAEPLHTRAWPTYHQRRHVRIATN